MDDFFDVDDPRHAPYEAERQTLLAAMLAIAGSEGWTRAAFDRAVRDSGLPAERAALIFPGGVLDVLAYDSAMLDRAMVAALTPGLVMDLKVRARIALGIKTRIDLLAPQEAAAHRAAALLALPPFAPYGLRLAYRTMDCLWRAIGDRSTDFNFYTKRALAAGVYLTTLAVWFSDASPDKAKAWATLENQIDRVMMIEGTKVQLRKFTKYLPSPWPLLGMLRYAGSAPASSSDGRPPNG